MDKKIFNRSSNFFRKEGFYVLLFVCLCIVATVAVLTSKSGKIAKVEPKQQEEVAQEVEKNPTTIVAEESKVQIENALQVKKNTGAVNVQKQDSVAAPVAKQTDNSFIKPVEGQVVGKYSEDLVNLKNSSTKTSRTNLGIDIKAEKGATVVASLDGEVEDVDTKSYGMTVVINHKNGLRTEYGNLDSDVAVKKGQIVKKGTVIGKVGDTTLNSALNDDAKFFLRFVVKKGNESIDPAKYVKY